MFVQPISLWEVPVPDETSQYNKEEIEKCWYHVSVSTSPLKAEKPDILDEILVQTKLGILGQTGIFPCT